MAVAPTINGQVMPERMWDRGEYDFVPKKADPNGQGIPQVYSFREMVWRWSELRAPYWQWLTVTVLGGAYSLQCNVTIWDISLDLDNPVTFTGVVVYRPTATGFSAGKFQEVEWRIGLI